MLIRLSSGTIAPVVGTDIELLHVLRLGTELLIRLHIDTIRTVIEIEVIYIGRPHVDAERVGDLRQRHVQALRFLTVNGYQVLRIVGGERRIKSHQILARCGLPDNVVRRVRQFLEGVRSLVLYHELKAAELSKAANGGRQRREDNRALNPEQARAHSIQNRGGAVLLALALLVRLQRDENQSLIRRGPGKTEAGNGKRSFQLRYVGEYV